MKRRSFLTTAMAGLGGGRAHAAGLDWPAAELRSAGFDSTRLHAARENLAALKSLGTVVGRVPHRILGLGETHGYRIPTKRISADGHALELIFSGLIFSGLIFNGVIYDAFCVRRMKLDF